MSEMCSCILCRAEREEAKQGRCEGCGEYREACCCEETEDEMERARR